MRYLSVCSGIEAATVAWHSLGWSPVAFSEIDPFPRAVLAHHYPGVSNLGDMTKFKGWPDAAIDLLVGGTPCQSFSVAGLRKGLDDPRGNLLLTYLGIADRFRPRWLVWENVPGVLSSGTGRDFGALLGGLAELGYGFAYRVLDAQHFGVPQRRRRVFVVGHLGDWRRAAAVLFERHSLSGDPAPRRQTGEGITASPGGIAGNVSSKWSKGSGGPAGDEHYNLIAAFSCKDHGADASDIAPTLRSMGHDGSHANGGGQLAVAFMADDYKDGGYEPCDTARPLTTGADRTRAAPIAAVATSSGHGWWSESDGMAQTLRAQDSITKADTLAISAMQVRRLTPRECERLQGFPDDYTLVPYRGKPAADGPRYKALGNSMAVPVMRWIGERIALVDELGRDST